MKTVGEDAGQAKVRRTKRALAIVTIIWLGCAVVVVAKRNQCGDLDVGLLQGLISFHEHYLACRPLNALGDFLAGVFAPLAFMWLAGAVYIQSQELNAQYSLMQAQKDEMASTATAMQLQADATEATKDFIARQTAILEDEQRKKAMIENDETFDQEIETFLETVRIHGGHEIAVISVDLNGEPISVGKVVPLLRSTASAQPIQAFAQMSAHLRFLQQRFQGMHGERLKPEPGSKETAIFLAFEIDRLSAGIELLSRPHQIKARSYRLADLSRALRELALLCDESFAG